MRTDIQIETGVWEHIRFHHTTKLNNSTTLVFIFNSFSIFNMQQQHVVYGVPPQQAGMVVPQQVGMTQPVYQVVAPAVTMRFRISSSFCNGDPEVCECDYPRNFEGRVRTINPLSDIPSSNIPFFNSLHPKNGNKSFKIPTATLLNSVLGEPLSCM
jgi:hypothetical protein